MDKVEKPEVFEGFQSQERNSSPKPIRIIYDSNRFQHFRRRQGQDWIFSYTVKKGQWNSGWIRESTNLDPYAIRNKFETADSEQKIEDFLSEAGRFWIWGSVSLSQFQEWQNYFYWLSMEPELARKDPAGRKALNMIERLCDESTIVRFSPESFKKMAPETFRHNEITDQRELLHLLTFAHDPELYSDRKVLKTARYDEAIDAPPENQKVRTRTSGKENLKPYQRIEVNYILEAIAATIYADREHGIKRGRCKNCKRLFTIETEHGQQFCPAPPGQISSRCKNAFMQKKRRDALREQKRRKVRKRSRE